MTESKANLLEPRYKVIADYPESNRSFRVGDVLPGERLVENSVRFDQYPHLFKSLHWSEERDYNDLPDYVRVTNYNGHPVGKVLEHLPIHGLVRLDGSLFGVHHYKNCEPATEQEYNEYLEWKEKPLLPDAEQLLKELKSGDITVGLNKYINPKNDAKFSPNLYKYLTYNRHKCFVNIFQDKETNYYYIGLMQDGWFTGAQLTRVFCVGAKAETFAWTPKDAANFVDITKQFWNKYLEIGKVIHDMPEWHKQNY